MLKINLISSEHFANHYVLSQYEAITIFHGFVDVVQSTFVNGLTVLPSFILQFLNCCRGVTKQKIIQINP